MSTNAIAIDTVQPTGRPWTDVVHEWVTTVDHKKIGILYIAYALFYLVIACVEALIMRIQLMHGHNDFGRHRSSTGCSPCMAPR
jgi:cytochrome c oxidase subunit 1